MRRPFSPSRRSWLCFVRSKAVWPCLNFAGSMGSARRAATSMDVSPVARVPSSRSDRFSQVANIYPASPDIGAPKWEFRVVSLDKWSASEWTIIKARFLTHRILPVGHISWISLQSLSQPQVAGWNSMLFRSIAQMIRAFLFATATIVRLTPRRSRSALIHRLSASVLRAATRTTDLAPCTSKVRRC